MPWWFWKGKRLMDWTKLSSIAAALAAVLIAVPATASAPVAAANAPGCLPLNGIQLTANSHENAALGITYDTNIDYWFQDGAVNWHRTVEGGEFGLGHSDTSGTVPAAPGSTATIPGTNRASPIIVTVCNQ
jgi:hypothetical protein